MRNKPHNDGDAYFENELKRLGVVSQRTINKYEINKKPSKYYHYCCTDCKQEYSTRKSLSKNNRMMFKCRCDGKLLFLGRKEVKK